MLELGTDRLGFLDVFMDDEKALAADRLMTNGGREGGRRRAGGGCDGQFFV